MQRAFTTISLSLLLLVGAAAQQPKKAPASPVCDPLNLLPGCKLADGGIFSGATDISTFLTNLADITGAQTLSTQIPGLQDPVGNACWAQLAPVQALIKAHPLPLTLKIASDIEAARLAMIAMNQVCANPNCGQAFLDATNAAAALTGAPIPLSLGSLCAKVPVIGTTAIPVSTIPTATINPAPPPNPAAVPSK